MSSKKLQSPTSTPNKKLNPAFTLIELSVVLIIIGLIVGGVLVGKDLLKAAQLRSSISILEKSSAAINTFRLKYNALPGDIQTLSSLVWESAVALDMEVMATAVFSATAIGIAPL